MGISILEFYKYVGNIEKILVGQKWFKIHINAWKNFKK